MAALKHWRLFGRRADAAASPAPPLPEPDVDGLDVLDVLEKYRVLGERRQRELHQGRRFALPGFALRTGREPMGTVTVPGLAGSAATVPPDRAGGITMQLQFAAAQQRAAEVRQRQQFDQRQRPGELPDLSRFRS